MNSYINPSATWLGQLPNSNFDVNRAEADGTQHSMTWVSAADPSFIVLHTMVGHEPGANARFQNAAAQVSANYGVLMTGGLVQWVDEKDAPYAEGNWEYNLNSIAIEHEDNSNASGYSGGYTNEEYTTSGHLVREICQRYGIPINRTYILKHKEIPGASTACPDDLDIDRIVAIANGTDAAVVIVNATPTDTVEGVSVSGLVYDTPNNDRSYRNWADLSFRMGEIAAVGTSVVWTEAKMVDGKWYNHLSDGRCLPDDTIDDGGFDPPHFKPVPVAPVVEPVTPIVPITPVVEPVVPPVTPADDDTTLATKADVAVLSDRIGRLETRLTDIIKALQTI